VRHEEAWTRLPDLLEDRDDSGLLAHVSVCAECQRQLFLLGRVDRLLRDTSKLVEARVRHHGRRLALASALALAAAASIALVLIFSGHPLTHPMVLRTASGESVAQAVMGHPDARNVSLALSARGLPVDRGHVFMLWAGDSTRAQMLVGRFMVNSSGGCRVHFNLPATHRWGRFWITRQGSPAAIVAST
jgi:hypothetical protein